DCTTDDVLYTQASPFSLPPQWSQLTLALKASLKCPTTSFVGVVFRAGRLRLVLDCQLGRLGVLDRTRGLADVWVPLETQAFKSLQTQATWITLSLAGPTASRVTVNGVAANSPTSLPPLFAHVQAGSADPSWGLGHDPSESVPSAAAPRTLPGQVLAALLVVDRALGSEGAAAVAVLDSLAAQTSRDDAPGAPPALSFEVESARSVLPADTDAFVGDVIRITARVQFKGQDADPCASGSPARVRLTWFGVPSETCSGGQCGDLKEEASGELGAVVELRSQAAFSKPGRFVVRLEASSGRGQVFAADRSLLVRKTGDVAALAPCCRHTPFVAASQLLRPVHESVFAPAS
ncbi:hypothetical protein H632_c3146p0, partial [Helicosporidium sp. ATCC 50920]